MTSMPDKEISALENNSISFHLLESKKIIIKGAVVSTQEKPIYRDRPIYIIKALLLIITTTLPHYHSLPPSFQLSP